MGAQVVFWTDILCCRGEDKFDMSALNARIQKVKAREANPVLNMQDKVADAMEPVKTEAVKMRNRLPDPKAAIPVTGLPKWVVSNFSCDASCDVALCVGEKKQRLSTPDPKPSHALRVRLAPFASPSVLPMWRYLFLRRTVLSGAAVGALRLRPFAVPPASSSHLLTKTWRL